MTHDVNPSVCCRRCGHNFVIPVGRSAPRKRAIAMALCAVGTFVGLYVLYLIAEVPNPLRVVPGALVWALGAYMMEKTKGKCPECGYTFNLVSLGRQRYRQVGGNYYFLGWLVIIALCALFTRVAWDVWTRV